MLFTTFKVILAQWLCKDCLFVKKSKKLVSLLHSTPSCSCFTIPCAMLLHLSLPELIVWCYCSFYWCQELRDMLVPIQAQMFRLINDTTSNLLGGLCSSFMSGATALKKPADVFTTNFHTMNSLHMLGCSLGNFCITSN